MTKRTDLHRILVRLEWILITQFGLDIRKCFNAFIRLPKFFIDYLIFRFQYDGLMSAVPCLHDAHAQGGTTSSEYFWQDLTVARKIFARNPKTHVDIGSRVDGFVGHVACFREIEVFDIRPIDALVPGVQFKQLDFMSKDNLNELNDYCDSLSCLHALEHFGLGRYGDPLDVVGYELGLANMSKMLKRHGIFYLSIPLGLERVEFNANRVFSPTNIIDLAKKNSLDFLSLTTINGGGISECFKNVDQVAATTMPRYILGIFEFEKIEQNNVKK